MGALVAGGATATNPLALVTLPFPTSCVPKIKLPGAELGANAVCRLMRPTWTEPSATAKIALSVSINTNSAELEFALGSGTMAPSPLEEMLTVQLAVVFVGVKIGRAH